MGAERNATPDQQGVKSEKMRALEEYGRRQDERIRRMNEPTPRNLAKAKIYNARTRIEIAEARKIIREWIDEHPEDRFGFGKYASDLRRKEIRLGGAEAMGGPVPTYRSHFEDAVLGPSGFSSSTLTWYEQEGSAG